MNLIHLTRLRARARRLSQSDADAEDLCHDVCLAMLERQACGARIDRPLPYMMTALRHAAQAQWNTTSRHQVLDDADHPQTDDASLARFCAEVLEHVETLPRADRALLRRVAYEQITPSELAEELDIPVGTVMSRLARARARLRDALGIETAF